MCVSAVWRGEGLRPGPQVIQDFFTNRRTCIFGFAPQDRAFARTGGHHINLYPIIPIRAHSGGAEGQFAPQASIQHPFLAQLLEDRAAHEGRQLAHDPAHDPIQIAALQVGQVRLHETEIEAQIVVFDHVDAPAVAPFPPTDRRAPLPETEGLQDVELHEINRNENSDSSSVRYDIHASGFTSDRPLVLWIWLLTVDHPTAVGQFILDAEGHLRGQVTNQLYEGLAVHNFYRGEALYVAVMTVDQSARAYAKVIPFPITSTSPDGCALDLELVSRAGTIFAATGRGFQPGEDVTTRSTALGETRQSTEKAGADGAFASELAPAVAGKDSGRASYTAAGEKCQVTLEYDWGLSAVRPAGRSPTDNEMQSGVRTDHTFLPNDHTEQRWTPEREG